MRKYPTQKDKTDRAFRAYLELLDAAAWFRSEVRIPLDSFGLTLPEFRVLYILHHEKRLQGIAELTRKRKSQWQNTDAILTRLEERGWVRRETVTLPPVEFERAHLASARRNEKREGRRVKVVGLTAEGKRFMKTVLPNHSKLVKSFMRVLDAREQESLFRLCRKLRENDILKFIGEIMMEDEE